MRRLLVLPLLLLALGACGDDGDDAVDTGAGDGPAGATLDGRTFVGGDGLDLVAGSEVRLSFADGQLGIQAGCNQMSGGYALDGDAISVTQVTQTEMGCDPALMEQDARLAGLFAEPVTVTLDEATLDLAFSDGTTASFTDEEVATPDADLVGPTWTLVTIITGAGPDGTASSVPEGVAASVTFRDDGHVVFATGCNSGSATHAVDGDTIAFSDAVATEVGCEGSPEGDVEAAVFAVLRSSGAVTAALDGETLTLTTADGTAGLGFTSA